MRLIQKDTQLIHFLTENHGDIVHLIGPLCEQLPKSIKKTEGTQKPAIPIIFVDGGSVLKPQCRQPSISVGDGDSSVNNLDILLPADKDFSDLSYVLKHLSAFKHIYLHGFLGARRDHEYFNIGEVHQFLKQHTQPKASKCAHFDNQFSLFNAGHWRFDINGPFSIGSLTDNKIRMHGQCQYQLLSDTVITPLSSRGLSNQAFGRIEIICQQPIMLFYPEATFSIIETI